MRILPALMLSAIVAQPAPRQAPEFVIHRTGAPDLKLSAYRGKTVLLAFLNTGCQHCQHFAQELAGLQKDYAVKGVQVLAVVFDANAKAGMSDFGQKYVRGFPLGYSDEATVLAWLGPIADQGYFVPIVAFVDRRGAIQGEHLGDDNLFQDPEANIRHQLDQLTKGTR